MSLLVPKRTFHYVFLSTLAVVALGLILAPQTTSATSHAGSLRPDARQLASRISLKQASPSTPPIFGPNLRANLDGTGAGQHEPSLAVSRVHTNTVIIASKDYRNDNVKQVWIDGSTNGGQTWPVQLQMPGIPADLNSQSDPVVIARDDGRIYVACVAYREPDRLHAGVYVTWTDDDGATWHDPSVPIFYPENQIDDKDWFAIDNSPTSPYYHRMYMMYSPGADYVVEQHSTDGGLTWSTRQQIAGARFEYTYPIVASDGTIYNFMMYNWGASNTGTIQFVKSTDGGLTWGARTTVATAYQPDSPIRTIDDFRFYAILSAAVDPNNGNLYVAWTDNRSITSNGTDVLYTRSTDNGTIWADPARLSHDQPGLVRDHITPILAVGADSKLHAFWLDRRLDPNNRLFDSWYSSSSDGGETWDPDTRVSTVSQDLNVGLPPNSGLAAGDYWGLDTALDTVYVAWNDSRTGDQDILVSKGLMYGDETATSTPTSGVSQSATPTHTRTNTPTATPPVCAGAYHYFRPQTGSPSNGGVVRVGQRFTLDMLVSTGPYDITAQQSYITFTYDVLQNVNASQPGCVLTSTVTRDNATFEIDLQNEVCNGPDPCVFRRLTIPAGYLAYASGALNNPSYNGPDFRVAQVAFCAIAAGQATIHWQFTPPAPMTRDTEIVEEGGGLINVRSCYTDYIINVDGPTRTPTITATSTPTATSTATPTVTPACASAFADVQLSDYFRDAVRYLYCAGIISGYSDHTFKPYDVTTRAQLAKIIVLAERWPFDLLGSPHFTDVASSNPFYVYVETVRNHGLMSGYSDRTFRPNDDITRAQLCKVIVLVRHWDITTGDGPHFKDVPTTDVFYGYIETARAWSVVSGYEDGTFRPGNNTTRAELTKIVYNTLLALVR